MCIAMFLLSPPASCICFIESILGLFCRYWCLKEAFVKAIGAGLGFGLQRLEFHHSNWTSISVYIDGVKSRDWRFLLFELGKGHWVSALHLVHSPCNIEDLDFYFSCDGCRCMAFVVCLARF